jgi:hypothetical protein
MSARREKLEKMLAAAPDDSLLRYMLAMELDRENQPAQSLEQFEHLMQQATPYVPAFLMSGQLLMRIGQTEKARSVFVAGIAAAQAAGNAHAAGEMAGFLSSLGN